MKHGVRIGEHKDGVLQVQQTVRRETAQNDPYVIDQHRERFIKPGDDAALLAAIRAASDGQL